MRVKASMVRTSGAVGEYSHRIAERDWRDGRDEVGIQSVHVAPFSHVSRFTRQGLWLDFSASCPVRPGGVREAGARVLDRTVHG